MSVPNLAETAQRQSSLLIAQGLLYQKGNFLCAVGDVNAKVLA